MEAVAEAPVEAGTLVCMRKLDGSEAVMDQTDAEVLNTGQIAHPDPVARWLLDQPEGKFVCMRKFDGTEEIMRPEAAAAIQVPEEEVVIKARTVGPEHPDADAVNMHFTEEGVAYRPCVQSIQVPVKDGETGDAVNYTTGQVTKSVQANPGTPATQVAGVEDQIKARELDPIQQQVAKAAIEALNRHGSGLCLHTAVEVHRPTTAVTPLILWDTNGTGGTGANYFASGGIAYFEAINTMVFNDVTQTTCRVRYSTNCGDGSSTGWIDLCDNHYVPFATNAVSTGSSIIATNTNGGTAAVAFGGGGGATATADTSGWVVRGATKTMRVLYQWLDGECRAATDVYYNQGWNAVPPKPPGERLREILQSRTAPAIIARRWAVPETKDIREQRARETLRRVLGEQKFRDFLRKGFVSVRAKSGLIYQIFPGHGITAVFDRATMVERLCVILRGDFPPTDSLIMRYLLILNNEDQFRSFAQKHSVDYIADQPMRQYPTYDPFGGFSSSRHMPKNPDQRSLVEIFAEMKGKGGKEIGSMYREEEIALDRQVEAVAVPV